MSFKWETRCCQNYAKYFRRLCHYYWIRVVEAGDEELNWKFLQSDVTYKPNPCQVLGRISVYAASVYLIFTVTLACFPAITAMVISHTITEEEGDNDWGTKFFIPVCCFVLFNVGDWLGRFLGERLGWPKPGRFGMWFTFVLSLLRIGFVPLFIFCNVNPTQRNMTHVVFDSDYYYIGNFWPFYTFLILQFYRVRIH